MKQKKATAIIVFVGCVILFIGTVYLFATDVDFFLNKRVVNGKLKVIGETNNKIELNISYYNGYKNKSVQKAKKVSNSYRNKIEELDSNNTTIIYTKWFNQVYVSEIKKPKILILFLEVIMLFFFSIGIKGSWKELFL